MEFAYQNQPSKLAPKKIKYGTTPGGNLWKAQDAALRQLEEDAKKQRELESKKEKEGSRKRGFSTTRCQRTRTLSL
ncbi:hypothetical protein METBIDRAFT_114929 [Metschnikowia bicuspidata var. bicuspidata NRRL YB-4993]|uniref:Uncharacterized protein n=1 Tax=Metschnikowia bicuspidata var. bicuspidata NRRL YB-4993 TaxID=869754 RepID=A0A1A0HJ59_9ASCO|nr:hypothetical protein METBIDRAFT_114929 [Metschnikowia bicuspidata var. bicuspidata NRRL YB-4993]OBA23922.1 hypothetical protein METBIDRAFT_114929 [Metschnikowia bicuspidata var. bicuspidata NRRL YB-4993]